MPITKFSPRQLAPFREWYSMPTTGAAFGVVGNAAWTVTGTLTTATLAATNILTSVRRTLFSSGTTAGTVASFRQAQTEFFRGNAAGLGGFYVSIKFGLDTLQSGMRAFLGISDVTTAPTNVDPTTNTTPGKIGMAINANTGNWQLVSNITGTAPTVTDLGANFPVNTTNLYELELFCQPNDTGISYCVTNLGTGAVVQGVITTNLPAQATFMTVVGWCTNNATAAAAIMAINQVSVAVPN